MTLDREKVLIMPQMTVLVNSYVFPDVPPTPAPNLPDFINWFYAITGVPQTAIAPDSVWFTYAYNYAIAIVNTQLACVAGPIYMLAVYNLATDFIFNWAPDLPGSLYPTNNPDKLGYFAYLRDKWGLTNFVAGVINASSDVSTSQSFTVPKFVDDLNMSDLQNMKTPWGRQYLALAQKVGTLWGLTI
jgi:hypothetical protein